MSWRSVIHVPVRKSGSLMVKSGNRLIGFAFRLYQPPMPVSIANKKAWYRIRGDENLRVQYDLGENDLVFDIGGYHGHWCAEITARYPSRVYVFEPVKEFYNGLVSRFARNKRVSIFPFGLAARDAEMEIAVMAEASSLYRDRNDVHSTFRKEKISLRGINSFIREHYVERIALMKVNIEGGEYELLEELVSAGTISMIDNVQVQFHDFVPGALDRMKRIKNTLTETHELTYEYVFVWENWKRKKPA
jgi:FkbM family methyltransferase